MSRKPIPASAFPHGDHRRYTRGCRCQPCKTAISKYHAKMRYLRTTGRGVHRSPDVAAQRITKLRNLGMSDREILAAASIVPDVLYRILRRDGQILVGTEARILAIPHPGNRTPASHARIDGTGTRRRLQALVASGWTLADLGRRLEVSKAAIGQVTHGGSSSVTLRTADRVQALYAQLTNLTPAAHVAAGNIKRAKAAATRRGWPDAQFWEDYEDRIDDPGFDPATAERAVPRAVQLAEDWAWLAEQGYTRRQAADRLGVTHAALEQAISRHARQYRTAA